MEKRRLKLKYRNILNILVIILAIICLITAIYSFTNIIIWKVNVNKNNTIKNNLKKFVIVKEKVIKEDDTIDNNEEEVFNVDFNKLKQMNSDTVAYLKVNNSKIDYVVVKGNDNDYYLNHNFNKEYNRSGWIFADYHNKFDGTDKNIVIYGHNTADGSMFGTLRNAYNKEWNDNLENRLITLITESGTYRYEIFSTYNIEPEDFYINTEFNNKEDYLNFLNVIRIRTFYDYKVKVTENDNILTLSTCTSNGTKRLVLHAKLIKD